MVRVHRALLLLAVPAAATAAPPAGDDLRRARFHAEELGQPRTCDVERVDFVDGTWRLVCHAATGDATIELAAWTSAWPPWPTAIAIGDELEVRLTRAGRGRDQPDGYGVAVALRGHLPAAAHEHTACICPAGPAPAPVPEGFDFRRLATERRLIGTSQTCAIRGFDHRNLAPPAAGERWSTSVYCHRGRFGAQLRLELASPDAALDIPYDARLEVRILDDRRLELTSIGPISTHAPPWQPTRD